MTVLELLSAPAWTGIIPADVLYDIGIDHSERKLVLVRDLPNLRFSLRTQFVVTNEQ
jgi:hypothetical protein